VKKLIWNASHCPTVCDGLVARWKLKGHAFEISASRNGVMLQGFTPALDRDQADAIIATIRAASVASRLIQRGLLKPNPDLVPPFPIGDWEGPEVEVPILAFAEGKVAP
jgi:hypothetical protein